VRLRSYLVVSVMFPSFTLLHTLHQMRHEGTLTDVHAHLGLLRFLFVEPGVIPKIAPGWRDYLRPDFHPWSRDDRELLARWAEGVDALRIYRRGLRSQMIFIISREDAPHFIGRAPRRRPRRPLCHCGLGRL